MPSLEKTEFTARITFLGLNLDRADSLRNVSVKHVRVGFDGFEGESHSGLTRPSCARVADLYPRNTEIKNTRQITILSAEQLGMIAEKMNIAVLDPCLIGASLVLEGIPDFSHIPPGARLQAENGTTLTIDLENRPCHLPALVINQDLPNKGAAFKLAAKNLRGVSAWVERSGTLALGDEIALFVPTQPAWRP